MPRIGFEPLPAYAWPGGTLAGTVVLETDKPARGRDLTLRLIGRELSQTTVSSGKSSQKIVDQAVIMEQEYDLRQIVAFVDPDHLAPGVYRGPFQFALPPNCTPSIHTAVYTPGGGIFNARRDGMYVEYVLEARLDVPWWADAVAQAIVPVYSSRRVLGALPPMQSNPNPGHPSITLSGNGSAPVLPGESVEIPFEVQNPGAKKLRALQLSLTRLIEYRIRGYSRVAKEPSFVGESLLEGRALSYTGRIGLPVPNTDDATGPWQGQLFRTYWVAKAVLEVELGFNVEVEAPLVPA